jgi:hypothetical protein
MDMSWEKPSFREVNMNSEIGAYQEDFDDDRKPGDMERRNLSADQAILGPDQAGTGT